MSTQKERLIARGKAIFNETKTHPLVGTLNCRLFAQFLMETPNIEKRPKLKKPEFGSILVWPKKGGMSYAHVAVYLSDGELYQVPEYDAAPEVIKLEKVEKMYGGKYLIFKPEKTVEQLYSPLDDAKANLKDKISAKYQIIPRGALNIKINLRDRL